MTLRSLLVGAAAIAGIVGLLASEACAGSTRVTIESGTIEGRDDGAVAAYKGIPYAAPPVGDLRWRAPQPVKAWVDIRDAGAFAPDCMQAPLGQVSQNSRHPVAEDCLYLNVWRPASGADKRPVMVWIHGGGFVNGGSSAADSTGESMAARGLVFVSLNYRLGRFGSFAFPALTAEHPEEAKGNYGFMDQIAALKWVRRNIEVFGGDPDNVTVVGESAGGMSANMLMTSPATKGLFARAIVQSGAGRKLPRERYLDKDLPDAASSTTLGLSFARKWGIAGGDTSALAALRALSAEQITDGLNMLTVLQWDKSLYGGPMIDGRLIVETPEAAYTAGHQQRVPLIVGATTWDLGLSDARTLEEAFVPFGTDAAAARNAYDPDNKGDMQAINVALAGDRTMVEPARFVARAVGSSGASAYEYRFSYVLVALRAKSPYGAQHATDVAYAFDRLKAVHGGIVSPADESMAAVMADYWANFARSGDPNGQGLPKWPAYLSSEDRLLDFGSDGVIAAKSDPWRKRLDLTERLAVVTQPDGPPRVFIGMYRYFADSGVFVPCGSGLRLPVAQEGGNAALEREYGRLVQKPGSEAFARLYARIVLHPKMDDDGLVPTLIVEQVGDLRPDGTCASLPGMETLENTYWKLTHLGDIPVVFAEQQREPHLIFQTEGHRVSGSTGCNRVIGQYTINSARMDLSRLASTRMACLAGTDVERGFLTALSQVKSWSIDGQQLQLSDAGGLVVARFHAQALK